MKILEQGIPRRSRVDYTPAELAVRNTAIEIEKLGADTRLTEAIVLLGRVGNLVADYIECVEYKQYIINNPNTSTTTPDRILDYLRPMDL